MGHKTHTGWVIEKDFDWGSSYLGIYYFNVGPLVGDTLGCRTMVFRTRRQTEAKKVSTLKGRGSRIVRVNVTIEAQEQK